jgi:hypothetical protein
VLEIPTGVEAHVQSTLSVNGASDGATVVERLGSSFEGEIKSCSLGYRQLNQDMSLSDVLCHQAVGTCGYLVAQYL